MVNKIEKVSNNENKISLLVIFLVIFIIIISAVSSFNNSTSSNSANSLYILASYDYKSVEDDIKTYAKKNKIDIDFKYMGDLDIVEELNNNSSSYDGVWISNSMWLYMLDNSYLYSDSKSLGISPVVFGIKKSKAQSLGLIDKEVTNTDILNLIKEKQIKYVMNSVTQTNTGATAYLGFLSSLAGNPEVLTEENLQDQTLIDNLKNVFSGVERVSGDEEYLEEMFLNDDSYEAIISSENYLIKLNQQLKANNKEELYFIYPSDGVAINDSTFAYISNGKDNEDDFLKIQSYLLSTDGQKLLSNNGIRTWYGGVSENPNKSVFNEDWGIDTTKYLNVTRFPSKSIITKALNLYIEELRKPTHVVFCLDYSGSMNSDGYNELVNAMKYILTYDEASQEKLQFSKNDKITVITFGTTIKHVYNATGQDTTQLISDIENESVSGTTALYNAITQGLDVLENESDDYTKTIIAMTDGMANVGSYYDLQTYYYDHNLNIPIYSITFGEADESQLNYIATLSNSKVFDGKTNLLTAFKAVRSYN